MATDATGSDKAIGVGTLFSLLALVGVVLMYLGVGEPLSGWGFAIAMLAGSLAVAAIHLW